MQIKIGLQVVQDKLNENYSSASVSSSAQHLSIVDSAPKTFLTTDYTIISQSANIFISGSVYGFDMIDVSKLSLQDMSIGQNDNNILINPNQSINGNLNPTTPSVESLTSH